MKKSKCSELEDRLSELPDALKLYFEKIVFDYTDQSMDTKLRIWTPNLETLQMIGAPYSAWNYEGGIYALTKSQCQDLKGLEKYKEEEGIFPELKMLVLKGDDDDIPIHANHEPKFETNLPKSFLLQLRTIEVYWTKGDTSFFSLVEFLLKYASRLEKVVFHRRMNRMAFDIEVFPFCITGAADENIKILTEMQS